MAKRVSVAEAKKDFSQIMSQVAFQGKRFLIERKGKPMAALVSIDELKKLESFSGTGKKSGLLAAAGAWQDFPRLDQVVIEIYNDRQKSKDRKIKKLS